MNNFFEDLFSKDECVEALRNSENIAGLVENLRPNFPGITAEKVRELFNIPNEIQDDFCLDYIFTLLEKMESLLKEDDSFLESVAGGNPNLNRFGINLDAPIGGSMGSYMTTAAYIGLGTQVLGGGLNLTNTFLSGNEARKTQREGFEQQKEMIELRTNSEIRLINAQRGI
jgi:hypothetical protein